MEQKILELLQARFEGVNSSILTRIAAKMAKKAANEEQAAEAVKNYTLSMLIESEADRRANEAQQSAVKNYEEKWKIKDGVPVANDDTDKKPSPTPAPKSNGDDMPQWARDLVEQNKRLSESLENMAKANITEGRKTQLASIVSKLPKSLRKGYERISLEGTDEEFSQLMTDISAEVDGIVQETKQRGIVFGQPKTGGKTDIEALSEEQKKNISGTGDKGEDAQPF